MFAPLTEKMVPEKREGTICVKQERPTLNKGGVLRFQLSGTHNAVLNLTRCRFNTHLAVHACDILRVDWVNKALNNGRE